MSYEELEEIVQNLEIKNGRDFWKSYILDELMSMCENKDFELSFVTKESIEKMIDNILANDSLFTEIDYAILNAIEEEIFKEKKI